MFTFTDLWKVRERWKVVGHWQRRGCLACKTAHRQVWTSIFWRNCNVKNQRKCYQKLALAKCHKGDGENL
jgi:hypothetical protein